MSKIVSNLFKNINNSSLRKKLAFFGIVVFLGIAVKLLFFPTKTEDVKYETTEVINGTLISTITGSGIITASNNAILTTKSSGTVKTVYV